MASENKSLIQLSQMIDQHRAGAYQWFTANPGEWLKVSTWMKKNMSLDGMEGIVQKLANLKLCGLQEEFSRRSLED